MNGKCLLLQYSLGVLIYCLGAVPAKERELGRTPDLPKVAFLYYICTYICSTTRALSHTPCGAVASTVAVDGTVRGAVDGELRSLATRASSG